MNREYVLKIDIINLALRCMISFAISAFIIVLVTGSETLIWKSLFLILVSGISYLVNRFAHNIWYNLGIHFILLAGCVCLTDSIVLKFAAAAFLIVFVVLQFAVASITLPYGLPLLLVYFIIAYGYPELVTVRWFFFFLSLLFILIFLLNLYYNNFYSYFKNYEEKANIPLKQIKSSNRFFVTGFLAVSMLVMLLFSMFPVDKVLGMASHYLRMLAKLLTRRSKPSEQEISEQDEIPIGFQQGVNAMFPEDEPSRIGELISQYVGYVLIAISLMIIALFLYYKMKQFYRFYYARKVQKSGEDTVELILPLKKERTGIHNGKKPKTKGFFRRFALTNSDRIRKEFKKAIQKNTCLEGNLQYHTPSQLTEYIILKEELRNDDPKKKKLLTTLYEKARYSNMECSKEEVQAVKNLLK